MHVILDYCSEKIFVCFCTFSILSPLLSPIYCLLLLSPTDCLLSPVSFSSPLLSTLPCILSPLLSPPLLSCLLSPPSSSLPDCPTKKMLAKHPLLIAPRKKMADER